MSEQREQEQTSERSVTLEVWGADVNSLEMAALDGAREFFGTEARLKVVRKYDARMWLLNPPERRFHAHITVREL